ncbi:MAG: tRNA 2-thiouridine(34) synthase MnmA [Bacteroidales bacterium]|nr:tRNA 2-thiouridine(34) synthase MnmA [Bacteroidales bacterium]
MKRVVVGLSGGVDSSVAAYLLKEQGYDVIGIYMQNWHDTTGLLYGDCAWTDDVQFATLVAKKLDIPFYQVDLSKDYKKRVVDYMFSEYEKGRTPNPDVLCNREVKFDLFVDVAKKYNADFVATGHYARIEKIENKQTYRLLAGKDNNKDQSYFLCQLNQKQLSGSLFPIGHLDKSDVRKIAAKLDLATATRKDSQGICFVGQVDLPTFLQQQLKPKEGNIVEIPKDFAAYSNVRNTLTELSEDYSYNEADGIVVGQHKGAHYFTIGQRKGLNVGGKPEPLFVIGTDVNQNIIYVGQGKKHPGLFRKALFISSEEVHWVRPDLEIEINTQLDVLCRIRYRQALQKATIYSKSEGLYISFNEAQRGISAGQFAAWYLDDELIGSGVIN